MQQITNAPIPLPALIGLMVAIVALIGIILTLAVMLWRRFRRRGGSPASLRTDPTVLAHPKHGKEDTSPIDRLETRVQHIEGEIVSLRQLIAGRLQNTQPAAPLPPLTALPTANMQTAVSPPRSPSPSPSPRDEMIRRAEAILRRYQEMLLHPAIQDFVDWAQTSGAEGVVLGTDGGLLPKGLAADSMLAKVELGDGRGFLVPGGPIVENFSTQYQKALTLRDHLGDMFELVTDGGGLLTLLEPAEIASEGAGWRIVVRGRLGGLTG